MPYTIYETISSLLLNDATIAGIVSSRVFNGWRPITVKTVPCINHFETESSKGVYGTFSNCTIQMNCWAETYKEARVLNEAVVAKLNHYGGTPSGGIHINKCVYANIKNELREIIPGTNKVLINIVTSYNVIYTADNE